MSLKMPYLKRTYRFYSIFLRKLDCFLGTKVLRKLNIKKIGDVGTNVSCLQT